MIVFTRASRVLMTMQDDGDRAKMTNGSGVWRLPECHTLMRCLLLTLFSNTFLFLGKIIKERLENNRIFVVATNETTAPAAIAFPLFF